VMASSPTASIWTTPSQAVAPSASPRGPLQNPQDSSTGDGYHLRPPQHRPPSAIADSRFLGEPRIDSLHL
jgi:hypothetical protein